MNMTNWAEREIKIACKRERGNKPETEWDYGCACYESAHKAFKCLIEDEHSGASIMFTKHILNRLIDGKPLTAIEDTPDVWEQVTTFKDNCKSFQCNRMSSLFKDVYNDGRVEYHDTQRFYCVNKDDPIVTWYNGFISKLLHKKYPITMLYFPTTTSYTVYCSEGLYDAKNGDFDTIGIWYVKTPTGEKETIERFFKESDSDIGWEEISKEEYFERVGD